MYEDKMATHRNCGVIRESKEYVSKTITRVHIYLSQIMCVRSLVYVTFVASGISILIGLSFLLLSESVLTIILFLERIPPPEKGKLCYCQLSMEGKEFRVV